MADREQHNEDLIRTAFDRQARGYSFFDILAEKVEWTVAASNPTTYTGRLRFIEEGVAPVTDRLSTPIRPAVRGLWARGDKVVAWWEGTATARDGRPYENSYLWILTLRDDRVVRAVAFLDTAALKELFERVPRPR